MTVHSVDATPAPVGKYRSATLCWLPQAAVGQKYAVALRLAYARSAVKRTVGAEKPVAAYEQAPLCCGWPNTLPRWL